MSTITYITIAAMTVLVIADHITGTAWYQTKGHTMFNDDHFDVFDMTDDELADFALSDDDMLGFGILTDEELAAIDEDIDAGVYDDDLLSDESFQDHLDYMGYEACDNFDADYHEV